MSLEWTQVVSQVVISGWVVWVGDVGGLGG